MQTAKFATILSRLALAALAAGTAAAHAGKPATPGNSNKPMQACSSADLQGGGFDFLGCSGYFEGNLVNGSDAAELTVQNILTQDPVQDLNATGSFSLKFEQGDGTGSVISFGAAGQLYGTVILGIHKGGAGEGGQGTAFYKLKITQDYGINSLTYNLGGLSNAGLYLNGTYTDNLPAVPEPQTYALMLAGLLGLAFVARRRA